MAKYSQGFKLKIVQEYLKGHLGYLLLAKNMAFHLQLQSNIGLGLIKLLEQKAYNVKQSMKNILFNSN
ncbi:hypothetical protein ACFVR1_12030 [Psychrobacillus sp. NPDC058041]|uniref:hypothetical protein n=1 Tax=Psychrobacillus sp. NPDC058041 TaxID=3346310 RepID=UPI0036D95B9F